MNPKERLVLIFLTFSLFVGSAISLYKKHRANQELQAIVSQLSMSETTIASSGTNVVNINTATLGELDRLPGIGPALAQRVIDFRTHNGPFKKKEDITRVSGIGKKKFEALKDMITIQADTGK